MDYSRTDLANRLAADYALGTMRGGARRRMEALLPAHPQLRRAVIEWEEQLVKLRSPQDQLTPSPHVWQAIEKRLFNAPAATAPRAAWWRSLPLWQTWSALSTVGALALLLTVGRPNPSGAPIVVVLKSQGQGASAINASFVASVSSDGGSIVLKPINPLTALAPGRALELWAVPAQGAPRSLGLLRADGQTTIMRAHLLKNTDAFAVSVEPEGGSATGAPSGPIISVGPLQL